MLPNPRGPAYTRRSRRRRGCAGGLNPIGGRLIRTTEGPIPGRGPNRPAIERLDLVAPAATLGADGVQLLELEISNPYAREALRLHRIEIAPAG